MEAENINKLLRVTVTFSKDENFKICQFTKQQEGRNENNNKQEQQGREERNKKKLTSRDVHKINGTKMFKSYSRENFTILYKDAVTIAKTNNAQIIEIETVNANPLFTKKLAFRGCCTGSILT